MFLCKLLYFVSLIAISTKSWFINKLITLQKGIEDHIFYHYILVFHINELIVEMCIVLDIFTILPPTLYTWQYDCMTIRSRARSWTCDTALTDEQLCSRARLTLQCAVEPTTSRTHNYTTMNNRAIVHT